jgi:hypothetical protein
MVRKREWIGVDFDGTLAHSVDWQGVNDGRVGEPLMPMVDRVRDWLESGLNVRIFTARVGAGSDVAKHTAAINEFCLEHFGQTLPITAAKDFDMVELWDDRAVQVEHNSGEPTAYWQTKI